MGCILVNFVLGEIPSITKYFRLLEINTSCLIVSVSFVNWHLGRAKSLISIQQHLDFYSDLNLSIDISIDQR